MADLNQAHTHPKDFWMPEQRDVEKKEKTRLIILGAAIIIALILLILCIITKILTAEIVGYVPNVTLELDLSALGKPPIVLASVQLPQVSSPYPENLQVVLPPSQQTLTFNKSFSPLVRRRVEFVPVYKPTCKFCLIK